VATNTPRINLVKPDGTDLVDIAVINSNYDKIDANIASTKIQATKPSTANAGDLWWDSNTGTLYLYYVDANSAQWVAATSDPVNIGVVANQSERDAQYPTPGQGMRVYRTDLGVTQTYYGLYNASTNPGGRDVAGWYNTEKSVGLVPIQPSTVTAVGGTATANSLGAITVTNCSAINLGSVFTSEYENYRVVYFFVKTSASGAHKTYARLSNAGTTSNTNYVSGYSGVSIGTTSLLSGGTQNNLFQLSEIYYNAGFSSGNFDILKPAQAYETQLTGMATVNTQTVNGVAITGARHTITTAYDGITLGIDVGTVSGTVQVFGYND